MKATLYKSIFNIDGDEIYYSSMKDMYETGHGHGLQINNEDVYNEVMKLCDEIADRFYKLEELLK